MYNATVRALVRHGIRRLNEGDPRFLLRLAASDAEIAFPGTNSWASMFRPVRQGREPHATHCGIDECRAFADRFVQEGVQFEIEDILVNGGPWNTRVAVQTQVYIAGPSGDAYNNRLVALLHLRWGKLALWEDYEDTERIAAWDRQRSATSR